MKNCKLLILACISSLASRNVWAKHIEHVKVNENCISENFACTIQNEGSGSSLLAEFNQTNRIGCFDRCSLNQLCQHWTWWGDNEQCQLFNQCQRSPAVCKDCLTGPRNCGMKERSLSAVSGGLSDDASVPNQNMIYMIDEHKICNLPSVMNELTAMPRSRWGHVSAFIGSKFFFCGGTTDLDGSIAPNNTCDAFCVARQQWVDMEPMSENRHGAIGVSLFGKMYVMGGHNGENVTKSAEVYDPMKMGWAMSSDMPVALTGHCAVTFKDLIIVTGGKMESGSETATVFTFNVTSNIWWQMQPMLHARSGHGCSLNTRPTAHSTAIYEIIVTGGLFGGQATSSAESFDFNTRTWTAFTDLPFNMANHAQLDLGSPRLYGGDISGSERNLIMQYTNTNWHLANVSIPSDLKFHHVTKYPANLVGC
eukprot:TRINITY_DN5369_c0_g1_i6.p1 TRINITY_DN5369_c0_g1~~TRINITY_DN5369_c0_g1_i6.p1  ORF type:complete len:423 (-),score=52.55 TRINITY_DN5369_c0_g1_i6:152-1420(-)